MDLLSLTLILGGPSLGMWQEPTPPVEEEVVEEAILEEPVLQEPIPDYQLPPFGYRDQDQMRARLTALASTTPAMHLLEIGRSPAGLPLLLASFDGPMAGGTAAPGSPEVLVVANLEGDRLAASEVAMAMVEHLASGDSPLLTHAAVHVLPVANPEAAAAALLGQDPWRGAAVDEDHDGRLDEDGPMDLDGDHVALWMRVPDPVGGMIADPEDPRSMREAKTEEGERGEFRLVREGGDADGDRKEMEDPLGGVRLEANFPHRWQQYAAEAGQYQLSEPESRALVDFVLQHPAIALVIVLDDEDNLAKPPSGKDKASPTSTEPLKQDATLLKLLSERLYADKDAPKPRGAENGSGNFADWAYFQFGAQVIESALWSPPLDVDPPEGEALPKEASEERKLLAWADAWYRGEAFRPWTSFEHLQLVLVEIGGWMPLVKNNPPAALLPELGAQWSTFLDDLAEDFARLAWGKIEIEALGDAGVYEVRAELINEGLMPTMSAMGGVNRHPLPLRVFLELPEGGELLVGRRISSQRSLDGSGGHAAFHWIYRLPAGSEPARLRAMSATAGEALSTLEVQ